MFEVHRTPEFDRWFAVLRDKSAQWRILTRIRRLELGQFGDVKALGDGVSELRIDHGPGYRLYFVRRGSVVIVLLCGGDKSTQSRDIDRARHMAKE